jgi:hypothetical protein
MLLLWPYRYTKYQRKTCASSFHLPGFSTPSSRGQRLGGRFRCTVVDGVPWLRFVAPRSHSAVAPLAPSSTASQCDNAFLIFPSRCDMRSLRSELWFLTTTQQASKPKCILPNICQTFQARRVSNDMACWKKALGELRSASRRI